MGRMIDISPTPRQEVAWDYVWDDETTQILYGGGVNSGKSWWTCEVALVIATGFDHVRICVGRNELKKLRESWLVTWYKVLRHHKLDPDTIFKFNGQDNYLQFSNGSRIDLVDLQYEPSDPEWQRLGSIEYTLAILEEAGEIEYRAFQVMLTRVGRVENQRHGIKPLIIMTCNPKKNFLYTEFYKPWTEGTLPKHMKFVPALITDNIHADPNSFTAMNTMGDRELRSRLYEGNWEYSTDDSALIEPEALQDIFSAKVSANVNPGNRYLTCDVARLGKDSTVVIEWSGLRAERIHRWEKQTITETRDKLKELIAALMKSQQGFSISRLIIDGDGLGAGLVDMFPGCVQFVNNAQPLMVKGKKGNFNNLKSQCYHKLAEMINNREVFIKCDNIKMQEEIREELEQVKLSDPDGDGKIAILSKKNVKKALGRSPDLGDALMIRMYAELNRSTGIRII